MTTIAKACAGIDHCPTAPYPASTDSRVNGRPSSANSGASARTTPMRVMLRVNQGVVSQ